MQRVRIGITGLAVVFLIVLLAATIVGFHSKNSTSSDAVDPEANAASAKPADPLAELGVAPGGTAGDGSRTDSSTADR